MAAVGFKAVLARLVLAAGFLVFLGAERSAAMPDIDAELNSTIISIAEELLDEDICARPGPEDNPMVLTFLKTFGDQTLRDETAWCAGFVGYVLKKSGVSISGANLAAKSFLDIGISISLEEAQPGDIVIFPRGDPNGPFGHVGIFTSWSKGRVRIIGGNQGPHGCVTRTSYPESAVIGVRRFKRREEKN